HAGAVPRKNRCRSGALVADHQGAQSEDQLRRATGGARSAVRRLILRLGIDGRLDCWSLSRQAAALPDSLVRRSMHANRPAYFAEGNLLLKDSRKTPSSVKDRGRVDCSEANYKSPETRMSLRMSPQWPKLDVGSCRVGCRRAVIDSRPEQNGRIETGLNPWHHEEVAPMDRCSLLERLRTFRIK